MFLQKQSLFFGFAVSCGKELAVCVCGDGDGACTSTCCHCVGVCVRLGWLFPPHVINGFLNAQDLNKILRIEIDLVVA